VSQEVGAEVGDANEPVGVEVAATTAGKEANLIVMDVLGVSRAPSEDEGHNVAAASTHSEVTVDGETEVADAGELLLPQQVPSSAVVQVPPLNLAALQSTSPPVSTPNASTKVQGNNGAGETSIFATLGRLATDSSELRMGLAQIGAQMAA
jgi:hypothetical protein